MLGSDHLVMRRGIPVRRHVGSISQNRELFGRIDKRVCGGVDGAFKAATITEIVGFVIFSSFFHSASIENSITSRRFRISRETPKHVSCRYPLSSFGQTWFG